MNDFIPNFDFPIHWRSNACKFAAKSFILTLYFFASGVSSDDIVNLARNLSSNSLVRSMTALTAAAAVGTATYYYATRPKPSAFGIDIENQSIIIDEQVSQVRHSALLSPDKLTRESSFRKAYEPRLCALQTVNSDNLCMKTPQRCTKDFNAACAYQVGLWGSLGVFRAFLCPSAN